MTAALSRTASAKPVHHDLSYSDADFRRIAAMLLEDAGIALPEGKAPLVYSRLAKRLRALNIKTFAAYCDYIASEDGALERREMLTALTTNVTHFFREPHHFDDLRTRVLPPLLDAARRGERLRIWSAGCSTGQEIYSIAMTLLEMEPNAAKHNIKLLATDIDPKVLEAGRQAIYGENVMANVSDARRKRFFERSGDGTLATWRARDNIRSLVSFKELNLTRSFPVRGPFDVIFCRNVVIYFDKPTEEAVWQRFNTVLGTGGYLFLGHSERVSGPAAHALIGSGVTTYQKQK